MSAAFHDAVIHGFLRQAFIMQHANWECPKCGHLEFQTDEFRATGSGLAKIFDVQDKKFTTVSCVNCRFTELYRSKTSALGNLFDLFTG